MMGFGLDGFWMLLIIVLVVLGMLALAKYLTKWTLENRHELHLQPNNFRRQFR